MKCRHCGSKDIVNITKVVGADGMDRYTCHACNKVTLYKHGHKATPPIVEDAQPEPEAESKPAPKKRGRKPKQESIASTEGGTSEVIAPDADTDTNTQ